MTLAETASTFAEDIVLGARLRDPALPATQRLALLDARLDGAAAFLLNIPMRFDFECALYDARTKGELSPAELCAMMEAAQRRNYGDVLDGGTLDPWFWASKLHFFITEISFYNFPYTFGYLFSRALTARFEAEGPRFLPRYEALLRDTGAAPAEEVARRHLGVDLGAPAFWTQAIDSLEPELRIYEAL
jgi:oligoendopeptidase F